MAIVACNVHDTCASVRPVVAQTLHPLSTIMSISSFHVTSSHCEFEGSGTAEIEAPALRLVAVPKFATPRLEFPYAGRAHTNLLEANLVVRRQKFALSYHEVHIAEKTSYAGKRRWSIEREQSFVDGPPLRQGRG